MDIENCLPTSAAYTYVVDSPKIPNNLKNTEVKTVRSQSCELFHQNALSAMKNLLSDVPK